MSEQDAATGLRQNLLNMLKAIRSGDLDGEDVHEKAEQLLLSVLGDAEVADAWNRAKGFWYYG